MKRSLEKHVGFNSHLLAAQTVSMFALWVPRFHRGDVLCFLEFQLEIFKHKFKEWVDRAWERIKGFEAQLLQFEIPKHDSWGFEVLAKVQRWNSIATLIRNVIPITLLLLQLIKTRYNLHLGPLSMKSQICWMIAKDLYNILSTLVCLRLDAWWLNTCQTHPHREAAFGHPSVEPFVGGSGWCSITNHKEWKWWKIMGHHRNNAFDQWRFGWSFWKAREGCNIGIIFAIDMEKTKRGAICANPSTQHYVCSLCFLYQQYKVWRGPSSFSNLMHLYTFMPKSGV